MTLSADVNELGSLVAISPIIELVRRDNLHIVHLREQTNIRLVRCNLVAVSKRGSAVAVANDAGNGVMDMAVVTTEVVDELADGSRLGRSNVFGHCFTFFFYDMLKHPCADIRTGVVFGVLISWDSE